MKKEEKAIVAVEGISSALSGLEANSDVRGVILEECKKAGITLEDVYKVLKDGLSATKTTLDKFGDEHTEDDFLTRHKFMVTALELVGHLKAKSEGAMSVNVINMSGIEREELERLRGSIYNEEIRNSEIVS